MSLNNQRNESRLVNGRRAGSIFVRGNDFPKYHDIMQRNECITGVGGLFV